MNLIRILNFMMCDTKKYKKGGSQILQIIKYLCFSDGKAKTGIKNFGRNRE